MRHIQALKNEGLYFVPENATEDEMRYYENEVERKLERLARTDIEFLGAESFRAEIVMRKTLDTIHDMRETGYWEKRAARENQ